MRHIVRLLVVTFAASSCGSAIAPRQADGRDCNYAEAATACGLSSYCDPGEPVGDRGYARKHTWGPFGDKTQVVGTCRPKGAAHAACNGQAGCVSGHCVHPTPNTPGVCE